MEAIVLAGGFGTRLRSVVADIPKPMAPIAGRPFLACLFDFLHDQGATRLVLCTGYRHEVVEGFFGAGYRGMAIAYSVEQEPLGTGGALKRALAMCASEHVAVLNGDTLFRVELQEMLELHIAGGRAITVALKPMRDFDRYGVVEVAEGRITAFREKSSCAAGHINGGVYIVNAGLFAGRELPERFSFETDFLEREVARLNIGAFISDGYFIDIGIPEDYARAQGELG